MKLTKANFQEWLTSKSPRTKVGTRSVEGNPVARFISTNGINVDDMPKWTVQFTDKLLQTGARTSSVSANAALNLL